MFAVLPFPFVFCEVFLFMWFVSKFGFLQTLAGYWLPSILGFLIVSFQSRTAMMQLQRQMGMGQKPGFQALNMAAKFLSGILIIAPFFSTRVVGILLLLPGFRHLLILTFKTWILSKIQGGAFRVFRAGGPGFPGGGFPGGGFPPPRGGRPADDEGPRVERDAVVIDVTPLEVEHTRKS